MKDRYDRKDTGNRDKEDKASPFRTFKSWLLLLCRKAAGSQISVQIMDMCLFIWQKLEKIKSALAMDVRKRSFGKGR